MKKFTFFFAISTLITLTSCIKTRAQLKESESNDSVSVHTSAPKNIDDSGGSYAVDELKAEITRLTGRIEDLEKGQTTGKTYKDEDIKKIETRLIELEKTQIEVLERLKSGAGAAPEKDPKEHLDKAKQAFEETQYETAVIETTAFLKSNPKNPEEALFLRADAHFRLKEFKKAIVDFSKFPEKYPDSPKTPKALLKIGQSFDNLQMKEDAQAFYQELQDKYPKSAEAKELKKKSKSTSKSSAHSKSSKKKKK